MELRAYDVVVSLSVGKSHNYQKLRINYVTATSCVSWYAAFIDARTHTHTHIIAQISEIAQRTNNTGTFY